MPTDKNQLWRLARRGLIEQAITGERLGKHPGFSEVRVRLSVYIPQTQRWVGLSGYSPTLEIGSPEDCEELLDVIDRAIGLWIAGKWDRTVGRFQGE